MTHDELLAEINKENPVIAYTTEVATELARQSESYLLSTYQKIGINTEVIIEQNALINKLKAQLRAVVELHKPALDTYTTPLDLDPPEVRNQYECEVCCVYYPCTTVQAIEKELR